MIKINRRSVYLINPGFQLRVSLFISTLVVVLGLIYPLIIYELFRQIIVNTGSQKTIDILKETTPTLITILITIHVCFFLLTFFICVFQAHKIAGPMYHLKKYLKGITQGNEITPLTFRKNDHFQDVAESVNEAIEYLNKKKN